MRAVVQRVTSSSVTVDNKVTGAIKKGLMVLLGVHEEDTNKDLDYMAEKLVNLRIFEDEEDVMNLSLLDIGGEALIVSQFTLMGDVRKGRRPSYSKAAKPDDANSMYEAFVEKIRSYGIKVGTGVFQADMLVDIKNDGPVTILLDSHKNF
ncbi:MULTISPECIES: D-aminoacyl-tRNA deacylase [unclassified Fusibacter]|uniref:D-aminoacyl-tRNA deacylase n=1 Tax=unclassified Fusibacter TaxID=2624464 RepID=UPI0010109F47|nr:MULTISPECIES: D-aminoacyl-tRNA deacylase [unclassified Fusibacter]MCK8059032.1 D-aminoacyl-tRNA deacylase [Fusibacter sp. A2]NPE22443.1 D-tyrosyl-tRNA(Tyr) deacylase [Fusibacter sp. A1]RXV60548.1 D-tyrosyl-tRNA(Tyr) deacylase [Fusibacter sp. A1]